MPDPVTDNLTSTQPQLIAAVDLGSNSFHSVVARYDSQHIEIIDRHKETVRLAAGLLPDGSLTADAQQRAVDCLARLSQLLSQVPSENIRAVGTNTLRRVKDGGRFLRLLESTLGARIDIIPGQEEARLIWMGVTKSLGDAPDKRLIVDIGGGSTEFIYGEGHTPHKLASLQIGCVRLSETYFKHGRITRLAFQKAQYAAMYELAPIQSKWRKNPWEVAIGTSGSAQAISQVLLENGLSPDGLITLDAMRKARKLCINLGHSEQLDLPGLSSDRKPVFAAGLAAMIGIFKSLKIKSMRTAQTALREGVLYDLIGDRQGREVRHESVRRLAKTHRVDHAHSRRVSRAARLLLSQVEQAWGLHEDPTTAFLHWAARLHEIGLTISFRGYHHHGGYLVDNSNLPGFSQQEQHLLATLVEGHRKRIPSERLEELTESKALSYLRLMILLRLAVYLLRDREPKKLEKLQLKAKDNKLKLSIPSSWQEKYPLTIMDLEYEVTKLAEVGIQLHLKYQ